MDAIRKPDLTTGAPANPALDQLAGLAAQVDAGAAEIENPGAAAEAAAAVQAMPDYMTEASGMVDMFAALVVGYEPRTAPIWDEKRKAGISAALAPVLEKYAFSMGNIPPEVYLLIMVAPPLYQTSKIIAEGMNAKPAQAGKVVAQQAEQVPGSTAVSTETHSPQMMGLEL